MRFILDAIWKSPERVGEILAEVVERSGDVYGFERMLEETQGAMEPVPSIPET